jgi:uncharacterized SAM-binding protein YcdF (DUF218 family)
MVLAIFGISVVLLGVIALIFKERILLAVGDYLVIQDELKPVDVIHVIAGDDYRTDYAVRLYKQGYARYIFFTGGWCQVHGYYHGEHGKQLALSQGVPQEAIAFDDSSVTSTYSETVRLNAWMDQRPVPVRSVIVVSDPFHMRRARWTNRQVLGKDIEIIMAPVPFDQIPYKRQWWTDEASRRYVKEEYIKTVYYFMRYRLTWGWVRDWLTSYDTG